MRYSIFIIFLIFFLSCSQNDTKQKELELKERELALKEKDFTLKHSDSVNNKNVDNSRTIASSSKTKNDTSIPTKIEQIKSAKETQWDEFWLLFSNAIKQKDKPKLIDLASRGNEFDGGAGGESAEDWAARMVSNSEGKYFVSVINMGVKPFGKGGKITKKHALFFDYKNNKWNWAGVSGD